MPSAHNHDLHVYRDDHPIERGFTLLEASAGTGKTYSLTFLYLRLLLEEKLPPREIVVVTFTNAAAAELRDRIHQRIAEAIHVLEHPDDQHTVDEGARDAIQKIVDRVIHSDGSQREELLQQLNEASATLDTSVISTIHSFAGRLGEEFSTITGTPSGATLVNNLYDTLDQALLDLEHQLAEQFPDAGRTLVEYDGKAHQFIRSIARVLLDNPDVLPPPDSILLLPAAPLLEHANRLRSFTEDPDRLSEKFVQNVRTFLQWLADEGADHWRTWFAEVRKIKAIHGNSIRVNSIEKSFETLEALSATLATMDPASILPSALIHALELQSSNGGPLRFFRYAFLQEKHKTAEGQTSASPTAHELPESSEAVEEIYTLANLLQNDAFETIWCYRVAQKAVELTRERAAVQGIRSHAQVIADVANALEDQQRDALIAAVQKRYSAALIDEFQDTDQLQWNIFQALFSPDHAITYLIGDPKQAIYGFRGANVAVYNNVRQHNVSPDRIMSLDTNYRSDLAYNETINGVFGVESPAELDGFVQIRSPKRSPERRLNLQTIAPPQALGDQQTVLTGGDPNDALIVRYVCELNAAPFAQHCADHITYEILALLKDDQTHRLHDGKDWVPIRTSDCAVLVRNNRHAQTVVETLQRAGIPAVLRDKESVALSDAADGLMHWLQALSQPRNSRAIRSFLFSPLVRMRLDTLDGLSDEELTAWAEFFGELRASWYRQGLHATLRHTLHRTLRTSTDAPDSPADVMSVLLSRDDGARVAGDLMHLAEVLNTAQRNERLSIEGLLSWFARARYDETYQSTENPLFQRHIATDDDAVQVVTGHSSKGLEYPLVWMFGFTEGDPKPSFLIHPNNPVTRYAVTQNNYARLKNLAKRPDAPPPLSDIDIQTLTDLFHAQYPSLRALQTTTSPQESKADFTLEDAVQASDAYAQGEDLRLLYVGLTRARQRAVIFVNARAGSSHNDADPTFMLDVPKGALDTFMAANPQGVGALTRTVPWRQGTLRIEQWLAPPSASIALQPHPRAELDLAEQMIIRTPPVITATRGQRPSFSSLLHLLPDHFGYFDLDEEPPPKDDSLESEQPIIASALEGESPQQKSTPTHLPLSNFASGREAGTALHTVFELVDFTGAQSSPLSDTFLDDVREQAHRALVSNGIDPFHQADVLQKGVIAALQTPFGGVLHDVKLADLSREDRLDEMQFLMPVGERDHATTARAIFRALQTRKGDPAIEDAWFEDLAVGMLQEIDLHGMMIGFIDLVFRAEVDGRTQYFVADYKSNRLAPQAEPITSAHFSQAAIRNEMAKHHYYLQYHIYLVALHRWLQARLPTYDYDLHVGGAYYLFVRGMEGPHTPVEDGYARGVFFDRPPKSVIEALDRALRHDEPFAQHEATV